MLAIALVTIFSAPVFAQDQTKPDLEKPSDVKSAASEKRVSSKTSEPVPVASKALESIKAAYNELIAAEQAFQVARIILSTKDDPCENRVLRQLEMTRAAKANAYQALEMSVRYLTGVPPTFELNLQTGQFAPPTKPANK
jgi:hypothetical protein